MAAIDCIKNVLKKIPGATPDDIENLYNSMTRMRAEAFAEGLTNPDSVFAAKAEKALKGFVEMIQRKETEALENIAKFSKAKAFVDDAAFKGGRAEGMRALSSGSSVKVDGARDSIQTRELGVRELLSRGFLQEMDEKNNPGITKIFTSNVLGREIAQEVSVLAGGKELPGPSSLEAKHIAKAIHKLNKLELDTLNKAGASINDLEGYIARQTHDADAIRKLGASNDERFAKWAEAIMPKLDYEKTFFKDFYEENPEKYLRSVFDKIMDGSSKVLQSDAADQFVKIIGTPSNLAKKLEMGRKLIFKDGASEFDYNQEFGAKKINEQVLSSIRSTSRNAAAMENLGTNWKATWERLQTGMDQVEKDRLSRYMKVMDGTSTRPGDSPAAVAGQTISMGLDLAKMGAVLSSHFGLLATRAATMMVNGDNLLSAHAKSLTSFLEGIPKSNQAEVMRLTGIGAETQISHMMHEVYSGQGAKPGRMATMHELMFKINGMSPAVKALEAGMGQMLSAELGKNAGAGFAAMPEALGRTLMRYGIDPVKWEVARMGVEDGGHGPMVGVGKIGEIPTQAVLDVMQQAKMIPEGTSAKAAMKMADKFKTDTQQQIAGYYADRNATAMGRPGTREKADFLQRGSLDDTVSGQAWRLLMKYKAYPISMTTRWGDMIAHELLAEQNTLAKVGTVTGLATSSILLGYLGYTASEMGRGHGVPDPFHPDTMMKSMVKGGMLGYAGDFLLGNMEQKGKIRGGLSGLAGPLFGQTDDVLDALRDVFAPQKPGGKSRWEKAGAQAARVAENNAPFSNLPILRPALDKLILNDIAEKMNPGYLRRERTRMKESGQSSIFGN